MSPKILVIDPGLEWTGVAVFDAVTKNLFAAVRAQGGGFKDDLWAVEDLAGRIASFAFGSAGSYSEVVFEWPQVYAGRARGRKDPNDLLPLTALTGAIVSKLHGRCGDFDCTLYRPHAWKGSKKANPTARWILSRLSDAERRLVGDIDAFEINLTAAEEKDREVSHPAHNTIDAIGIGLHHLGRLGRKRVIAR